MNPDDPRPTPEAGKRERGKGRAGGAAPNGKRPPPNSLRSAAERNRKRLRTVQRTVALSAGVLLLLAAVWGWLCSPPLGSKPPPPRVIVVIPKGAGLFGIGRLLQENGVVRSGWTFALFASLHAGGRTLKAGRHKVSADMTLDAVLDALQRADIPKEEGIAVTFPEGYTLEQIARRLEQKGIVTQAALLAAATDPRVIGTLHAEFPLPQDTLEGYLFPDTYRFPAHAPAADVLQKLVLNFGARFARPYQQETARSGHSLHEIVTLASLIEREARVPADRARIAGVLENRLRRKMRLEVDATVLYALDRHKSRVTYRDLLVRSPYNTYRHPGLPPGPIACPGLPSLLAALHPERNDDLYYVARPNGAHLFSRTLREHEAAKQEVRQERKAARLESAGQGADPGG